ncbi:MAG: 5-formyltetrahydrofolate cyclo-ligase [Clostridia bacterium]|nr:5-formyltetrahydrofolate cyclo-ligase [Clostridia bacterium]
MDIKAIKTALREQFLEKRAAMSKEEKERRDQKICRLILSSASFRYAETILAYAPKENEIDIRPVLQKALAEGKRLALPRCEGEHLMTYRYITSLDELAPAAFGLYEPSANAPTFEEDPGHSSLCLVPGVVFDVHGYRIGYGGGYYDRFLHNFHGSVAGLIYRDFIVPSLPRGRFDRALPIMITDGGMISAK